MLRVYVALWWIGSVIYALHINSVKLPTGVDPWAFSIVVTALILLLPSLMRCSINPDYTPTYRDRVIGFCNAVNIWSVILGSQLIGGRATYYVKLAEPLMVLLVEMLIFGRQSLSSTHAKNGLVSICLLILFAMTAQLTTPRIADAKFRIYSVIVGAISVISVAIKVVLGAKRNNEKDSDEGYILFLVRSLFGFKYVVGFACFAVILNMNMFISNMLSFAPAIVIIIITQNLYNYASVEVNVRRLACEYVNGKIIKRIIVLIALTCHDSMIVQRIASSGRLALSSQPITHQNGTADSFEQHQKEKIVIFGAIGRHNFGDMLMAEVFSESLMNYCDISDYDVFFAGILARNMSAYGGRNVEGITSFMSSNATTHVVHVGGETAGCDIKSALRMFDPDPILPQLNTPEWKNFTSPLAYIVNKSLFANPGSFVANTIGGTSEEADIILSSFDFVSTRDFPGSKLKKFAPDSVILIKDIFKDKIAAHKPTISNYIAVQFRPLENVTVISDQLVHLVKETHLAVIFFRAGAAPGHDQLKPYEKLKQIMADQGVRDDVHIFTGLDIWDIAAVIAHSELTIGTSLHVRIIAFAFSVPRVTFSAEGKHRNMVENWDFGAITCGITTTKSNYIFKTAMATINCGAFKDENNSQKAEQSYREMFKQMIEKMGICNLSNLSN